MPVRFQIGCLVAAGLLVAGACGGDSSAESRERTLDTTTSTVPAETLPLPVYSLESLHLGEQQAFSFVSNSGVEIEYLLHVPRTYDEGTEWPLILFLHWNLGQDWTMDGLRGATPVAWFESGADFPFLLVAPMGPSGPWSPYYEPMEELFAVLGESLSIDDDALFLTGPSTGAAGTWQWALARPDSFTGIAPIAGAPSRSTVVPDDICRLVDLPIWVAHSEADPLSIDLHAATVAALEACGSTGVRFTVYENLGHVASVRTVYAGPDLYDWMLEQIP